MSAKHEKLEKRSNPRYLARMAIFHGPYQRKILTDYTVNISNGGVFIESSMILLEDTEVTVKFNLPNSDIILVVKARVAWTNNPGPLKKTSLPSGMGLQFLNLSLENMNTIRTFLDKGEVVPTW